MAANTVQRHAFVGAADAENVVPAVAAATTFILVAVSGKQVHMGFTEAEAEGAEALPVPKGFYGTVFSIPLEIGEAVWMRGSAGTSTNFILVG